MESSRPEPRFPAPPESATQHVNVVIRDIDMSFGDMVRFILKWMFASIPAMIVFFIFAAIMSAIFGGLLAGIMST